MLSYKIDPAKMINNCNKEVLNMSIDVTSGFLGGEISSDLDVLLEGDSIQPSNTSQSNNP